MKTELLYSHPSLATQSMILGRRSDSIRVFPILSQSMALSFLVRLFAVDTVIGEVCKKKMVEIICQRMKQEQKLRIKLFPNV